MPNGFARRAKVQWCQKPVSVGDGRGLGTNGTVFTKFGCQPRIDNNRVPDGTAVREAGKNNSPHLMRYNLSSGTGCQEIAATMRLHP